MSPAAGPRVAWVDNRTDPPETVTFLQELGNYRRSGLASGLFAPVVLRPTPGGGDCTGIGFDLLTALGKSPTVMQDERFRLTGHEVWTTARAWLAGTGISDLIIDRAHVLDPSVLADLARAAHRAAATPWMIWSSLDDEAAAATIKALTTAGCHVAAMAVDTMRSRLPSPQPDLRAVRAALGVPMWPVLPAADFTTFRAACRRHLGRDAFARVDQVYRTARDRTHQQMTEFYRAMLETCG